MRPSHASSKLTPLIDGAWRGEVGLSHTVRDQWRAERRERSEDLGGVVRGRSDEDVEISGRPREMVRRERVRADDDVVDSVLAQACQQIAEVVVEVGCRHDRRKMRPGALERA
jgi:hypothetical protein